MYRKVISRINKSYYLHKLSEPIRTFTVRGKLYRYFCHRYNTTWLNERAVEVPLIWSEVQRYPNDQVLEVGNVLSHYFPTTHQVVDKYETAPKVMNQDIVKFHSKKKFMLIVSISTLEHVGWDESPRDKQKILTAIKVLMRLLRPGGTLIMTLPLGYNPHLDQYLRTNTLHFDTSLFLKRTSAFNTWREVSKHVLEEHPQYNHPFQNANVIVIGTYRKEL
ncbi:MAG TPA: hypothetical protein DCX25_03785 [Candidatus Pacebacteria bacterium]|nr:MAG: hypothetical protein UX36_C0001G0397 [Microgenomates group bacterium GW2011_GWC1_46_15]HAV15426.1 hypothetical protein [Candidatus Paceibacterota bacterium]HCR11515.1 hypothetical protein [Candidatus Paceibacterota bacterium]HCR92936.1 hypothetical protein [Candidatus Paceibacterota bacterium]